MDNKDIEMILKLSADLCHDAGTQIFTINSISNMLERVLPQLLEAHQFAIQQGKQPPLTERDHQRLSRIQSGLPLVASELNRLHTQFWQQLEATTKEAKHQNQHPQQHTYNEATPKECYVLIVDDEPLFQESYADLFDELNCQVVTASSGKKALALINDNSFDLILMDCRMPHMDGFETTRKIKEIEQSKLTHTPVIGLTASPLKADRKQGLHAGMCDFIVKPLELEQAKDLINRYAIH